MSDLVNDRRRPRAAGIFSTEEEPLEDVDRIAEVGLRVGVDVDAGELSTAGRLTASKEPGEHVNRVSKIHPGVAVSIGAILLFTLTRLYPGESEEVAQQRAGEPASESLRTIPFERGHQLLHSKTRRSPDPPGAWSSNHHLIVPPRSAAMNEYATRTLDHPPALWYK